MFFFQEAVNRGRRWGRDHIKSKELDMRIAEMICVDNQPFTVLEDVGFQRLMKLACPLYVLPSRKYIKELVETAIFDKLTTKLTEHLAEVPFLSCTSDLWTEDTNGNAFISLTAHWVTADFHQQHMVLQMEPFNDPHTADNISEKLLQGLQGHNIPPAKVHMVLTDAASNIKRGVADAGLPGQDCFLHKLSTIVKETVYSQRSVVTICSQIRRMVGHFNHSLPAKTALKQKQIELGMKTLKMFGDNNTRLVKLFFKI